MKLAFKATNSYENYQIINLANGLAKELTRNTNYQNMEYYTLSNIALKQAQSSSMDSDLNKFESALDNAWAYADIMYDVNRGVAIGVRQIIIDTAKGIYQLVTQPVDSYLSLSSAIYNYDKTYEIITNNIKNDINNFPNLSTEEKAKLITQSSFEIATFFSPKTLVKGSLQARKIADASAFASNKIVDHYAKVLPKPESHLYPLPKYVSDNIPAGSLIKNEVNKGHTIAKHVGWSNMELKKRAVNDIKVNGGKTSTFINIAIAEQSIANTIIQNKADINKWLNDPKAIKPEAFNLKNSSNHLIGTSYNRKTDQFINVTNTRIVLKKNKDFSEGYSILTAFPIE
ncbi:MAG: hypothetical protein K2X69_12435 [Silvanigrellaceae bacterium]|nr:hypothetical protein [Silvanigrellaceae bacterium]